MDAADDLPSWPKIITWSTAFLALWMGSMAVVIRLSTGAWGGTQADPLWVGPVAAGSGLVAAIVIAVPGVAILDAVKARRLGAAPAVPVPPLAPVEQPYPCAHSYAAPVESIVTGELLAAICLDCDQALPAALRQ